MKKIVLLADFGSTFSKFVAVNVAEAKIAGKVTLPTTNQTSLMDCYNQAVKQLRSLESVGFSDFTDQIFCSSAWGGFKMVAIGLTESLTVEAAKRAALGAGTKILKTFYYKLTKEQIFDISQLAPDVVLLTGGTDGGNQQIVLHNAQLLARYLTDTVILFAGNQHASEQVKQLFETSTCPIFISENVMPKVNVLNVEPVRSIARNIFMQKIIDAKGIQQVAKQSALSIIPTPVAVLEAAKLYADGNKNSKVTVVDIGGATTDIHTIGISQPKCENIFYRGLPEPDLKRTVEGDLGMRSSATSLAENVGYAYLKSKLSNLWNVLEIEQACHERSINSNFLASSEKEIELEQLLAATAGNLALIRHAGTLTTHQTPNRTIFYQSGKDLRDFDILIGTGGVIVHSKEPSQLLTSCLHHEQTNLLPEHPKLLLDQHYLLSSLGILGQKYPEQALTLMRSALLTVGNNP